METNRWSIRLCKTYIFNQFNTSVLSKLASYENSFRNPLRKQEKNNMLDTIARTKKLILIPPKKL